MEKMNALIEYATRRRDEAIAQNEGSETIQYWNGYIDALNAVQKM